MDKHHAVHYTMNVVTIAAVVIVVIWVMYFHQVPMVLN